MGWRFCHRERIVFHGLQHGQAGDAAVFGLRAVHDHGHALTRQQMRQQGREHRQFASAVVARQHHASGMGRDLNAVEARMCGV